MITFFNYLSIALLFVSIFYLGRQLSSYLRRRKELGKIISPLTPSRSRIKQIRIIALVFLVLLILVTYNYISQGYNLNGSYSFVLAVVIFNVGRFYSRISECREGGILGSLKGIPYKTIKQYSVDKQVNKSIFSFKLRDGREFVAVVADKDIDEVTKTLKTYI